MATPGELFQTVDTKLANVEVRASGVLLTDVASVEFTFGISQVPTATIRLRDVPPDVVQFRAPLQIEIGYAGQGGEGFSTPLREFTGRIYHINPDERGTTIECMGTSWALDVPYHKVVKTFDNITSQQAIEDFLIAAGILNYNVSMPDWTIGTVVLSDDPEQAHITLEFNTYAEAINKVGEPDGARWMELPDGTIIVRPLDPVPALIPWRQYFSMQMTGLDTFDYPTGITQTLNGRDTLPRLRDIRAEQQIRAVKNQVFVQGATVTQINPDGTEDAIDIVGDASAPSPWVRNPDGSQAYNDELFANELIDTVAKAQEVAGRRVGVLNRLNYAVTATIDFDVEMILGRTVQLEDPNYSRLTGNFFVESYVTTVAIPEGEGSQGIATTVITATGGADAGGQTNISPFALFTHKLDRQVMNDRVWVIITLDGTLSSDLDGTIVSWHFTDNQGILDSTDAITYARYDPLTITPPLKITLEVTDDLGATDTLELTLDVEETADGMVIPSYFVANDTGFSYSPDGGITWFNQPAPPGDSVISVSSSPGEIGVAVFGTQLGAVYLTTDGLANPPVQVMAPVGEPMVHVLHNKNHALEVLALTQDGRLYYSLLGGIAGAWALWDNLRTKLGLPALRGARIATPYPDGYWIFGGQGNGLPLIVRDPSRSHQWAHAALGGELADDLGAGLAGDGTVYIQSEGALHVARAAVGSNVWEERQDAGGGGTFTRFRFALDALWRLEFKGACEECTESVGTLQRSTDQGLTWQDIGPAPILNNDSDWWGAKSYDFAADGRLWVQYGTYGYSTPSPDDGIGIRLYRVDSPLDASPTFTLVDSYNTQALGVFWPIPNCVVCHPTEPGHVAHIIGENGGNGKVRYTITGQAATPTFIQVSSGVALTASVHMELSMLAGARLVLLRNTSDDNIYISDDHGANWSTPVTTLAGNNLRRLWNGRNSAGTIQFLSTATGTGTEIWRSIDTGSSWTRILNDTGGAGHNVIAICYDEVEDSLYLGFSDAGANALITRIDSASTVGADAGVQVDISDSLQSVPYSFDDVKGIAIDRRNAQTGAGPELYVAEAASREVGELAIILNSDSHSPAVYYTDAINGDGTRWRRCLNSPTQTHGRWIMPNFQVGEFSFAFDDNKNYNADVSLDSGSVHVLSAVEAPGQLDAGDAPNHGIWLGGEIGGGGGSYLIAAEGAVDGTIYKTWDRFETDPVDKAWPASGFPVYYPTGNAKMISPSLGAAPSGGDSLLVTRSAVGTNPDTYPRQTAELGSGAWSQLENGASVSQELVGEMQKLGANFYRIKNHTNENTSDLYLVGTVGQLQRSSDGGLSWSDVGPSPHVVGSSGWGITDVAIDAGGWLWCVGSNGSSASGSAGDEYKIYRSEDDGLTWDLIYTDTNKTGGLWDRATGIICHPLNQQIIMVLVTSALWVLRTLTTPNRGTSWTRRTPATIQNTSARRQGIMWSSGRAFFVAGGIDDSVYYTDDYGAIVTEPPSPVHNGQFITHVIRGDLNGLAFVCGGSALAPEIARTIDYGVTWETIVDSPTIPSNTGRGGWLAYDEGLDILYYCNGRANADGTHPDRVLAFDNASTIAAADAAAQPYRSLQLTLDSVIGGAVAPRGMVALRS